MCVANGATFTAQNPGFRVRYGAEVAAWYWDSFFKSQASLCVMETPRKYVVSFIHADAMISGLGYQAADAESYVDVSSLKSLILAVGIKGMHGLLFVVGCPAHRSMLARGRSSQNT